MSFSFPFLRNVWASISTGMLLGNVNFPISLSKQYEILWFCWQKRELFLPFCSCCWIYVFECDTFSLVKKEVQYLVQFVSNYAYYAFVSNYAYTYTSQVAPEVHGTGCQRELMSWKRKNYLARTQTDSMRRSTSCKVWSARRRMRPTGSSTRLLLRK